MPTFINDKAFSIIKMKLKAKALAAEARIIREEELKPYYKQYMKEIAKPLSVRHVWCGYHSNTLYMQRAYVIRNEARATYLAIAYLEGRPYSSVEKKRNKGADKYTFDCVVSKMKKLVYFPGSMDSKEERDKKVAEWFKT